jgi:multidrug efflux pump subunit AcrA (membrane-fusion protein)
LVGPLPPAPPPPPPPPPPAGAPPDAADRDLADLKRDRAALTVTSPIDGVVVYGAFDHKAWQPVDPKRLAPDEKVQPEQVLLTVFQPGKLKVTAACPLSKVTLLPPGSRVTVTSPAVPEASYDGTAGAAAVVVTGSKADATVDVPVTVTGVDPHLAPGYTATVAVDVPPVTDVLLVPTSSVWHGKAWVHGADGQDEPRLVRVGRTDGQQVEVRSGLSDGDVVLTKAKKPGAAG